MTKTAPPVNRYAALDGMRGFALFLVLLSHSGASMGIVTLATYPIFNAYRALVVFFCLSGFLITLILVKELDRTGTIDLKAFFVRRVRRLAPAMVVFLVVVGVLGLTTTHFAFSFGDWLGSLLFFQNYSPWSDSWWLGHTWSLAVEVQFYLFWPFVLLLGRKRASLVAMAVIVILPVTRVAQYLLLADTRESISTTFHTRVDGFLIGSVLALLFTDPRFRDRVVRVGTFLAIPSLVFLLVIEPYVSGVLEGLYYLPVGYTLDALATASLITAAMAGHRIVTAVASWKPWVWLGTVSYSVYLYQQLFLSKQNEAPWNALYLGVPLAIAVGALSFYAVEKPFMKPSARAGRRKAASGDPAPPLTKDESASVRTDSV